ncbi:hypothetical protein EV672_104101 [Aquabacterium commune]|uniref:Uncharacterized protein n=2 Tax=Aquabacterium commune TaxID=70586 RepID=A0A4R6RC48_9BURK|nr:hypothetical protein EV672_104101 [Aquabacterium commune]
MRVARRALPPSAFWTGDARAASSFG